ncbi:MAG: hypothetical protein GEV28_04160 [Actinophytocola sp.]|uniref:TolB family protein n=1 Tax=Actinophytocola sp. TaxID=1872138 RepID=UPI0013220995|nr:hypothetical protein [Actinophytocola sp.]MPZ79623.1 hypothetical protein [Actinophytocola sp.]
MLSSEVVVVRRVVLVVAGLVLAGCSPTVGGAGMPLPGHPVDVESLRVTGTQPVAAEGAMRLSPDGTRLLHLGDMCVTALDGSQRKCVDRDKAHPDIQRAEWSPDGKHLVFTDDFWRLLLEPDVWVFDIESGELRNLTDDGVDKYDLFEPDPDAKVDVLPSWSPDGGTIRFARGGAAKDDRMHLMTVAADGGDVHILREVDCATPQLVALAWTTGRVAWACGNQGPEVMAASITGGDPDTLMAGKEGEDRMLLSFSPDGESLLVDSMASYSAYDQTGGGMARVVPAGGGDPVRVADGKVGYPTWAPDGDAIAYVEMPGKLKVVAEPGGEPRELRSADRFAASDGMRLSWAPGKILVYEDGDTTFLTLEE